MSQYRSRGQNLHYTAYGDTGPCVVLLHGFTNYSGLWAAQALALAYAGYRVLVPDLAGHALSQAADASTTVDDLAADVVQLLDAEHEQRAVVGGLSLGGMIALTFAANFPERANAIVVAASSARTSDEQSVAQIQGWIDTLESRNGPAQRLEKAWPKLCTETFRASTHGKAYYATWQNALRNVPGSSLANVARGMQSYDVSSRLGHIDCPSLIIAGQEDEIIPPQASIALADAIPRAELRMLPGTGHLATLDAADDCNRHVLEFLADARRKES